MRSLPTRMGECHRCRSGFLLKGWVPPSSLFNSPSAMRWHDMKAFSRYGASTLDFLFSRNKSVYSQYSDRAAPSELRQEPSEGPSVLNNWNNFISKTSSYQTQIWILNWIQAGLLITSMWLAQFNHSQRVKNVLYKNLCPATNQHLQ